MVVKVMVGHEKLIAKQMDMFCMKYLSIKKRNCFGFLPKAIKEPKGANTLTYAAWSVSLLIKSFAKNPDFTAGKDHNPCWTA